MNFNPNGPGPVPDKGDYKFILSKDFYDHNGKSYTQIVDGYFSRTGTIILDPYSIDCIYGNETLRKKDWAQYYREIHKGVRNFTVNPDTEKEMTEKQKASIGDLNVFYHARSLEMIVKAAEYEFLRDEVYDKVHEIMKKEGYKSCYIMYSSNRQY
jgi:hypothetical protein